MEESAQIGTPTQNFVPVVNVVSAATYEAQQKAIADAKAQEMAKTQVKSSLLSFLQRCYDEASNAKITSGVHDRLLEAQRRRKGEHSAEKLAQLKKYKLPVYWVPLTQTKCIHTESWLRDILMPYADKIWKCLPTEIPELQEDEKQNVLAALMEEAKKYIMSGGMVSDEEINTVREKLENDYKKAIMAEAKDRADNMQTLVQDQLEECDFRSVFREFQSNLTTYGTAFLKGPFTILRKSPAWNGEKRIVIDKLIPSCSAPSPLDMYPAPWAKNENEGWMIERIRTFREGLSSVRKLEYYQTKEIEALLSENQGASSVTVQYGDTQRDENENKGSPAAVDTRIECYQFSGPIPGYLLLEWGMKDIDGVNDYNVEVLWSKDHILKVMPMWDETGVKPYFRAVFKQVPGSFWGVGVPLLMSASQDRANAVMTLLLDNTSWGTGFIGWINQNRLVNMDDVKEMHSKKWIPVQASTTPGDNGPPMGSVTFDLKIVELSGQYQQCLSDADNESGVPAYMYGSGAAGPASGTYSGLQTLMNASARGIKDCLLSIDEALSRFVSHWADWNNEYSEDESVKGDIRVVCSGSTGLFVQEMQLQKLDELANQAKDLIPVIGPRFNVDILRQKARILKANSDLIPSDDEIRAKLEAPAPEQPQPIKPTMNISVKLETLPGDIQLALLKEVGITGAEPPQEPQQGQPPSSPEIPNGAQSAPAEVIPPGEVRRVQPLQPIEQPY